MIPAPRGFLASYKQEMGEGVNPHWTHKSIVGWNEDGDPLVVDQKGFLCRADRYTNFDGVQDCATDPSDIVALIPGGGWQVEYTQDDGTKTRWQILAWGLEANGNVVALDTDSSGFVMPIESKGVRIFHPADGEQGHSSSEG